MNGKLFKKGDVVAIAASGGKDSTVLAQVLKTLNGRYNYELKLVLLSIDEGITGKFIMFYLLNACSYNTILCVYLMHVQK